MEKQRIPFQFIGNDLVLDFVNTCIVMGARNCDLIEHPNQLSSWLKEAGVQTSIGDWSDEDISQLHLLRDAIRSLLRATIESNAPDTSALSLINKYLEHHVTQSYLSHDGTIFHIDEGRTDMTPNMVMSYLASRTATLLISTDQNRIKACSGPKCVLVFKDTSKSGHRKWCSMETCGNRSKAAKFRENIV